MSRRKRRVLLLTLLLAAHICLCGIAGFFFGNPIQGGTREIIAAEPPRTISVETPDGIQKTSSTGTLIETEFIYPFPNWLVVLTYGGVAVFVVLLAREVRRKEPQ